MSTRTQALCGTWTENPLLSARGEWFQAKGVRGKTKAVQHRVKDQKASFHVEIGYFISSLSWFAEKGPTGS